VENKLRKEQYGFRSNRSMVDLIVVVKQILKKRWELADMFGFYRH
jgi:hypothetical protein